MGIYIFLFVVILLQVYFMYHLWKSWQKHKEIERQFLEECGKTIREIYLNKDTQ